MPVICEHLLEPPDRGRIRRKDTKSLKENWLVLPTLQIGCQPPRHLEHVGVDVRAQQPQRAVCGHERLSWFANTLQQDLLSLSILECGQNLQGQRTQPWVVERRPQGLD